MRSPRPSAGPAVVAAGHDDDLGRGLFALPALRTREQFAVIVLAGDLENADCGNAPALA